MFLSVWGCHKFVIGEDGCLCLDMAVTGCSQFEEDVGMVPGGHLGVRGSRGVDLYVQWMCFWEARSAFYIVEVAILVFGIGWKRFVLREFRPMVESQVVLQVGVVWEGKVWWKANEVWRGIFVRIMVDFQPTNGFQKVSMIWYGYI